MGNPLDYDAFEGVPLARRSPWDVIKGIIHVTSISSTSTSNVGVSFYCLKLYLTKTKSKTNISVPFEYL